MIAFTVSMTAEGKTLWITSVIGHEKVICDAVAVCLGMGKLTRNGLGKNVTCGDVTAED